MPRGGFALKFYDPLYALVLQAGYFFHDRIIIEPSAKRQRYDGSFFSFQVSRLTLRIMKTPILFLISIWMIQPIYAESGKPADLPEAGRIRVDGRLDDWKNIVWTPLDQTLNGNPVSISNAQWALRWNDDAALFIAVRYTDTDIILQDSYVGSNAQDCVEIFVRGDTGSSPEEYAATQESAQHYIFGLAKNKIAVWKKLVATDPFPAHNPAVAAVIRNGNLLTYEIMVPLYDRFDRSGRRSAKTEVFPDVEIGVDIAIVDVGTEGYAGRKSENTMQDKDRNAAHIAEHMLGE